jgi:hypothetical protein
MLAIDACVNCPCFWMYLARLSLNYRLRARFSIHNSILDENYEMKVDFTSISFFSWAS